MSSTFFGCISDDKFGRMLEDKARALGVNVQFQFTEKEPTGTCAVIVTGDFRYGKTTKYSDNQKIAVIILKFEQCVSAIDKLSSKNADGMANSVDPDQPFFLHLSNALLLAKTFRSEQPMTE